MSNDTTDVGEVDSSASLSFPTEGKLLTLVLYPDDRLSKIALAVDVFDKELTDLAHNMLFTMRAHNGIGLAGPQVGVDKRIIVVQIDNEPAVVMINPYIGTVCDGTHVEVEEGCLSVPDYFEKRQRPGRIIVNYTDVNSNSHEVELSGLYAFAVQHEMDHLDGKLFIDDLSQFKKQRIKARIKKIKHKTNNMAGQLQVGRTH